jgi:transmembrane 9 superfamily protein 3
VPIAYYGAYNGFTMSDDKPSCKVSAVRRKIPLLPWYQGETLTILIAGFVMFSTVMVELHYVITSVWRSYMYGLFGFLLLNLNLLVIVVALVSIVNTYLCLRAQNWNWWWRAFFSGFSIGFWIFGYCMYHMMFIF